MNGYELIDKLERDHCLSIEEYEALLDAQDDKLQAYAAEKATPWRKKYYGDEIYTRGLIEFTNYCKNDCHYCGIQRSNKQANRYRLTREEILACCDEGYDLGFRTFVLQGGEDPYFTDEVMVDLIQAIKEAHPDCALTLSIGERSRESYQKMYDAGADRYLLRHETADPDHYAYLHPADQTFENRMKCLNDLKEIGYQVGVGLMVGSPKQTNHMLAEDLIFIQNYKPAMCGIGPFIPQHDTVFKDMPQGTLGQTLFLLSILRLIHPNMLIPATTALGTINPLGREMGVKAGANVVMPNLSPVGVRKKYELYDNKICTGEESAQCRGCLSRRMDSIGAELVVDRGDAKEF